MKIMLFLGSLFFLNTGYALGVNPIVIQSDATQQGVSGVFNVSNNENTEQEVKLFTTPFTYDDKGFKTLASSADDLSTYLFFSPKVMTLKPNETRQIRYNARFLSSTAAGEYKTMIFVEQSAPSTITTSGTGMIPRIGLALYVRVGGVKAELAVQGASYKDKQLLLAIANTGKATARPRSEWTLEQAGKTIVSNKGMKTMFDAKTVVADSKRTIEIKAPELEKLAAGNYRLSGTLFWGDTDENKLTFDQSFVVH